MRFATYSPSLTREARESGEFIDKRSKIGLRANGTKFLKLFGSDMSRQRERVFYRDRWRCVICGNAPWDLELDHYPLSRGKGGDDSMANLRAICRACHRMRHLRILSGKVGA